MRSDALFVAVSGMMAGLAVSNALFRLVPAHAVLAVMVLLVLCALYSLVYTLITTLRMRRSHKKNLEELKNMTEELRLALERIRRKMENPNA